MITIIERVIKMEKKLLKFNIIIVILLAILTGICIIMKQSVLAIILLGLLIIVSEFCIKLEKEYIQLEYLTKILGNLVLGTEPVDIIQEKRNSIISLTTKLQRFMYKLEYGKELK